MSHVTPHFMLSKELYRPRLICPHFIRTVIYWSHSHTTVLKNIYKQSGLSESPVKKTQTEDLPKVKMIRFLLFLISLSNAKGLAFPQKENEHEASVNVEQIIGELDGNCLESTRQMMSIIRDKITEMKDCFLRPDGSITNMESMSPCTAGLEETVQKALYHPGISDPGESQDFT